MIHKIELWRWFLRRFQASYSNYLTWHGFDTVKFDTEVIKSGDASALETCRSKFGHVAACFLEKSARWKPDEVPSKDSIIEFNTDNPNELAEIEALIINYPPM